MSRSIDKRDIARSFGNAAETYDSVATLQRNVGNRLIELLKSKVGAAHSLRALDIGTGTGYFLPSIRAEFNCEYLLACDLSEGMTRYAQKNHHESGDAFMVGDAESLPFQSESFDLVFSSLALQWCSDLPRLFSELKRVVKPKGWIGFSTLLDGTLSELKSSWSHADAAEPGATEPQHVNEFFALTDYEQVASSLSGLRASWFVEDEVLYYGKAMSLMRELKSLGAHNMASDRSKGLTGKQRLMRFINAYEDYRDASGRLPATYRCCYGLLQVGE